MVTQSAPIHLITHHFPLLTVQEKSRGNIYPASNQQCVAKLDKKVFLLHLESDCQNCALDSNLFTSSYLLKRLKNNFVGKKICSFGLFLDNFGQLISSSILIELVDNSKQQQSLRNSANDSMSVK